MSKPFDQIKKIYDEIKKTNISRDELASLDEKELQRILHMTIFIEGWSSGVSRIIDQSATASPSFLQKITKFFNETTTFKTWSKDITEMKTEDLYKAQEALTKAISNIDYMLDFVDKEVEKAENFKKFWGNGESSQ